METLMGHITIYLILLFREFKAWKVLGVLRLPILFYRWSWKNLNKGKDSKFGRRTLKSQSDFLSHMFHAC